MNKTTGPIRAVVATGLSNTPVVLATDSDWIASDCENVSDNADDIGLETPGAGEGPGLWLWEGTGKMAGYSGPEGEEPPEPEYTGTLRRLTDGAEIVELLKMCPPPVCLVCEEPAEHKHGPNAVPWCGKEECSRTLMEWQEDRG